MFWCGIKRSIYVAELRAKLWFSWFLQIAATHERVTKLEQDKEHWMLESQLLQVKYEKEVKVCALSIISQRQIPSPVDQVAWA